MALIKMSSVGITAISGKAGGSVYSRNRGGEYVKNFVMPTNTFSEARQAVRAVFGAISSSWRSLSGAQRNSWIEQAPRYLKNNVFGDAKQLSPNALYVAQNQNLVNAGLSQIQTIVAPEGTNALVSETATPVFDIGVGDTFEFDFSLEFDNTTEENEYVLEATPGFQASRRNVENQYRKLATSAIDGTTPTSAAIDESAFAASSSALLAAYIDKFGSPAPGDYVSFRIKAINPTTGEVSTPFVSRVPVTETS